MSIIEPNVLELLENADTRYTLVVEASKRGRQLLAGAQPLIMNAEDQTTKPLRVAVEEIDRGLITYERVKHQDEESVEQ